MGDKGGVTYNLSIHFTMAIKKSTYKPTDPKLVAIRKERMWVKGKKKVKVLTAAQKEARAKYDF